MERAIYIAKNMRITQGMYGSYSHKSRQAIDEAGIDTGIDSMFAPFTCVVKRVYSKGSNTVWFESVNKVKFANGIEDYATIQLTHMDNVAGFTVGKVYKQFESFYKEGRDGNATGNHVHIECARGKFTGVGWSKNASGDWQINNPISPVDLFFLLKGYTKVIKDYGYKWVWTDSGTFNVTPPLKTEAELMTLVKAAFDSPKTVKKIVITYTDNTSVEINA